MAIEPGDMMVILAAIANDDAKNRRISEIHEEMKKLEAKDAEQKAMGEQAAQDYRAAKAANAEARRIADENQKKTLELDARERGLGELQEALNAEKHAFEGV